MGGSGENHQKACSVSYFKWPPSLFIPSEPELEEFANSVATNRRVLSSQDAQGAPDCLDSDVDCLSSLLEYRGLRKANLHFLEVHKFVLRCNELMVATPIYRGEE